MKRMLAVAGVTAALLLPGCRDQQPSEPDTGGGSAATASPTPDITPPTSIIRPEVASEVVETERLSPLEVTIPFGDGGYSLNAEAVAALEELVRSDQLAEGWPVILRGHTDSAGTDDANLRASRRRAEAVAKWLVEKGVVRDRIEVIALGEQRPVAPNAHLDGTPDEEGRAANRRVTVIVAAPAENAPAEDARDANGGPPNN
ncbi:MAG TPA: OmpA family protein [Croceibacterium sp.]|nr:OmpA family protein [Croceibacterium sp.]